VTAGRVIKWLIVVSRCCITARSFIIGGSYYDCTDALFVVGDNTYLCWSSDI
jgi:hypothetical protein